MFSLLLLASALLAFGGPQTSVLGTLDANAAAELDAEKLIDQIIRYQRQLEIEQKKRQNQAKILKEKSRKTDFDSGFDRQPLEEEINFQEKENGEDESPGDNNNNNAVPTTTGESAFTHKPPEALSQANHENTGAASDTVFLKIIIVVCSCVGLVGLIMAGVCWYKLQSQVKAASDVEYPAYGVTGPTKERLPSPGDRKLAQSAQMYHYQHQKQQMIAMEKANGEMKQDASEEESEEENEEGDYTVYECPGLAPTGEMEVRNPLFTEESQTPVNGQPPPVNGLGDDTAE